MATSEAYSLAIDEAKSRVILCLRTFQRRFQAQQPSRFDLGGHVRKFESYGLRLSEFPCQTLCAPGISQRVPSPENSMYLGSNANTPPAERFHRKLESESIVPDPIFLGDFHILEHQGGCLIPECPTCLPLAPSWNPGMSRSTISIDVAMSFVSVGLSDDEVGGCAAAAGRSNLWSHSTGNGLPCQWP